MTASESPVATDAPAPVVELVAVPERLPGEPEAIFIVGASRSGTSLMRTLLERSDRIALARENHFLGHLRESEGARYYFRRAGDPRDDETMRSIARMIYSGDFQRQSRWREVSTFWRWLIENVPQDEMERRLLAAERTERGMWVAFLRAYADRLGRPIIGEKTPAHLAHVATLLEWFPDARVVHMLRDPRGVYVSDLRRRRNKLRKPYSWFAKVPGLLPLTILFQTAVVWRGVVSVTRGTRGSFRTAIGWSASRTWCRAQRRPSKGSIGSLALRCQPTRLTSASCHRASGAVSRVSTRLRPADGASTSTRSPSASSRSSCMDRCAAWATRNEAALRPLGHHRVALR